MQDFLWFQIELFARLVLAAVCGGIIGYERKNRGKGAGIRTHFVVAAASALIMIISKYGFSDLTRIVAGSIDEFKLDPSRVAAQIVSGIGFLGAGMIYIHGKKTQGLTTAAGIWATAGIGMAIGSGMYAIGIFSTILIVGAQMLLHKNLRIFMNSVDEHIVLVIEDSPEAIISIKGIFDAMEIQLDNLSMKKLDNSLVRLDAEMTVSTDIDSLEMIKVLNETGYIKEVDLNRE